MHTVVVGSGVLGASTAYHLARAGARVTVVDAGLAGRATAAGAGIICPWVSSVQDDIFYRLYAAGGDYYPELVERLAALGETSLGYRQVGAMLVSGDRKDLDWIESLARQRQADNPAMGKVTRMTPEQARALFPPLRADFGGVHVAGAARVDGRLLAASLLRAARHHGTTVVGARAEIRVEAGRVTGVDLRQSDPLLPADAAAASEPHQASPTWIPADRVIVTAGAWADQLFRPVGLTMPVEPQRGQIVHLRLENVATDHWPVILPPGNHYIVPFDDGRIVAGATRETGSGFDYRVTAAGQADVLSQALGIAPGLGVATMIETRVGFRPVGAEIRPMLGWMRPVEGLAVGNGLGAAGLTIGPFAGRLLADLILGHPAMLDLAPFDPMRRAEQTEGLVAALR